MIFTGQIPATWSPAAKNLLRNVVSQENEIVDWIDRNLKTGCISPTDPFEEHVVAIVKQRSFDDTLVPLWDMFNHANAPHVNTNNTSMYDESGYMKVWASQPIQAGEELFESYDMCLDCRNIRNEWGTPEILRDFGFVEGYPHRYMYEEAGLWFDVSELDNEGKKKIVHWDDDGTYTINWEDGVSFGAPNGTAIEFMRKEIEKLDALSNHARADSSIPKHELDVILQYRDAAIFDLTLAIEEAERKLTNEKDLDGACNTNGVKNFQMARKQ